MRRKGKFMPIISQFYGIIIRMYFLQSELKSPHIHTIYKEFVAVISITDSKILFGTFPTKAYNLVKE